MGKRDIVTLQPSQYSKVGFVQNHHQLGHRPTKSQESLPLDLPPEQRHLFEALTSKKRKLFQELNLDDTNDSSTKKGKILCEQNVEAQGMQFQHALHHGSQDRNLTLTILRV
ncbi:unnamed protein product [Cuscuta campestris]|uniref:Uncharacterized protein n=1 Tax=Cuscuta campestris TaxID=132261 RepID=A0A484N4S4_9ASTE|nr:unnamed protein product [Cuscuta campestris]